MSTAEATAKRPISSTPGQSAGISAAMFYAEDAEFQVQAQTIMHTLTANN